MNKKKWLTLGIVGTALALLPRRSSRQATFSTSDESKKNDAKTKNPQPKDSKDKGFGEKKTNRQ